MMFLGIILCKEMSSKLRRLGIYSRVGERVGVESLLRIMHFGGWRRLGSFPVGLGMFVRR